MLGVGNYPPPSFFKFRKYQKNESSYHFHFFLEKMQLDLTRQNNAPPKKKGLYTYAPFPRCISIFTLYFPKSLHEIYFYTYNKLFSSNVIARPTCSQLFSLLVRESQKFVQVVLFSGRYKPCVPLRVTLPRTDGLRLTICTCVMCIF